MGKKAKKAKINAEKTIILHTMAWYMRLTEEDKDRYDNYRQTWFTPEAEEAEIEGQELTSAHTQLMESLA